MQVGCYRINMENRVAAKPQIYGSRKVIDRIFTKLTTEQIAKLRETPLGYFMDIPEFKIQNQLLHALLLHEIHEPGKEGLWFKFGDAKIRFSVMEFALISGLRCYGDADMEHFIVAGSTNRLKDLYFKGFATSAKRSEVEVVFDKA